MDDVVEGDIRGVKGWKDVIIFELWLRLRWRGRCEEGEDDWFRGFFGYDCVCVLVICVDWGSVDVVECMVNGCCVCGVWNVLCIWLWMVSCW